MVIDVQDSYSSFVITTRELRPVLAVFYYDQTALEGGQFFAFAIFGSTSAGVTVRTPAKPSSFTTDFPHAIQVEPGFGLVG